MASWWGDVIREAQYKGDHTRVVQISHRYGMILFIASEVMFFVAWFWAYFNSALFPAERSGARDAIFDAAPHSVGACAVRLAAEGHRDVRSLASAAAQHADPADLGHDGDLGASRSAGKRPPGPEVGPDPHDPARRLFTCVQAFEYGHAPFSFSGNIYGATFFMATGFHGFHVLIGTIFLLVCLFRAYAGHFTPTQHLGFEFAAWYWHFVDVVWLFLFTCIYVWGRGGVAASARIRSPPSRSKGAASGRPFFVSGLDLSAAGINYRHVDRSTRLLCPTRSCAD